MKSLSVYPLPGVPYTHDASAAVLGESGLLYAYEEERLLRRQHAMTVFPELSSVMGLKVTGTSPGEIGELVVTSIIECQKRQDYEDKIHYAKHVLSLPDDIPAYCVPHHLSHSALAVLTSPFETCAFLTADGGGDWEMGHWGTFDGRQFAIRERFRFSPAIFFSYISTLAGFSLFEEGKVMGLSAFGSIDDRLYSWLRRAFYVPAGSASMAISDDVDLQWEMPLDPAKFDADAPRRHKYRKLGVRFHRSEDADWLSRVAPWDIAATGQKVFEELVERAVLNVVEASGCTRVALCGGAFQNILVNGRLQRIPGLEVFVPVAPHDAGLAAGGGLLRVFERTGKRPDLPGRGAYSGPEFTREHIESRLRAFGLKYSVPGDLASAAARELVGGRIVGWFSGPGELGARALGARSVLADPRDPLAKARLNQTMKRRDWFMPYAPSVLEEHGGSLFEDFAPSPFMNRAFRIRSGKGDQIPSALHVDGTCRAHTVDARFHPHYRRLIEEFYGLTGVPMVLNTSFNRHGLPMAATPDHAIQHLLEGCVDCLAIGEFLVEPLAVQRQVPAVLSDEECFEIEKAAFAARRE